MKSLIGGDCPQNPPPIPPIPPDTSFNPLISQPSTVVEEDLYPTVGVNGSNLGRHHDTESALPTSSVSTSSRKIKSHVFRTAKKSKPTVRYSPILSDLRVKELLSQSPENGTYTKRVLPNWASKQTNRVEDENMATEGWASDDASSAIAIEDDDASVTQEEATAPKVNLHCSPTIEVPVKPQENVWKKNLDTGVSYADQMKANLVNNVRLEYYIPPIITSDGKCRIVLTNEDLGHSAKEFALYLYGYFLGSSMDFNKVNLCLKHLWKIYDLAEISKNTAGFYFFKFKSEIGLNTVLEKGVWMVNNVPIFLNKWEPGLCLEKVEPSAMHLWVTVHNVPMELWTEKGMSKLFSGIGIPRLLDKITQARVVGKTGKMGYARMLVEAKATSNLPDEVEVEYPAGPNSNARIGVLKASYQWKPASCSHCCVFGHSLKLCNKRPRTEEEIAEKAAKELSVKTPIVVESPACDKLVDFTPVFRKNRKGNGNANGPPKHAPALKRVDLDVPSSTTGNTVLGKSTNEKPVSSKDKNLGASGNAGSVNKSKTGFNFSRAVQGIIGQNNRFEVLSDPIDTTNRVDEEPGPSFSVMNCSASVKHNKLVAENVKINQPDPMTVEEIVDNRMLEEHLRDDVLSEEGFDESKDTTCDHTKEEVDATIRLARELGMNLVGMEDLVCKTIEEEGFKALR